MRTALLLMAGICAAPWLRAQGAIEVHVDLTDAPRKILHSTMRIPALPGPLTLVYARWIPGDHGPTGPIDELAGIEMRANGQPLRWRRDDVNMFAFHVQVPPGATALDVKADFLATAPPSGDSEVASTTAKLAVLNWNQVMLYPAGRPAAAIECLPSVRLPADWKYGTALERTGGSDDAPAFAPVSLETLVDSPLLAGRFFREIPLAPELTPRHYLDLAADGPEDLALSPEAQAAYSRLVRETGALYRSRHYTSYHFLVTLSDEVSHFGLEHHQSSDDRMEEKTLLDPGLSYLSADLLPHEFTHSWNGKYRRPAGLATGNYEDPMKGDMLWVYEGMTQYWGDVLAARSGIESADQYREELAASAAELDHRPGRSWRDLEDTARAAQTLYAADPEWDNWRRGVDYYPEGALLWLEVDTILRRESHDARSLNDFAASFLGPAGNSPPRVLPYTFEDVVAALNGLVRYGWAALLEERITSKSPRAPLQGIEQAGYRLVYNQRPNAYLEAREAVSGGVNAWYTLGLRVGREGNILDVLMGSPADRAGAGPDMTIVAVNMRQYSPELLRRAIADSRTAQDGVDLLVSNTGYYRLLHLDYQAGALYPHLERGNGPALLDEILKPLTK